MPRVNVYLPDDLADMVKHAGLNVSSIAQEALRAALTDMATDSWLDEVARLGLPTVTHDEVLAAVDAARDELGHRGTP
jgi:post-segregation antitoxin (ccd killing protein)